MPSIRRKNPEEVRAEQRQNREFQAAMIAKAVKAWEAAHANKKPR